MKATFEKLKTLPEVQKGMKFIEDDAQNTFDQILELVQIPAFSRHEEKKADRFQEMVETEGYKTVRDEVNNVYTIIEGSDPKAPTLYVSAHLDTVFPLDTPLNIRQEGNRYYCPGIGDDTAHLGDVLCLLRAFRESGVKPRGSVILGGNVGEEGLGDLYGMKNFFKNNADKVDGFLSIDGSGEGVCEAGTGSHRYKVSFRGPGGHSNGDFGMPNPIHALGRAISKFADMPAVPDPWTTFSIGVIDGGTSINSIAMECSMLVDMRSNGKQELDDLDFEFQRLMRAAVDEENARWKRDRKLLATNPHLGYQDREPADRLVEMTIEQVGDRPVGNQTPDAEICRIAEACYESVGRKISFTGAGSTDANIPLSLGIPAMAICGSGKEGNGHNVNEWFEFTDFGVGIGKIFLMILGMVGVEGETDPLLTRRDR